MAKTQNKPKAAEKSEKQKILALKGKDRRTT
jgi:hypothetical protein